MNYFQIFKTSSLKGLAKHAVPFIFSIGIAAILSACSVSNPQGPQPVFQNTDDTKNLFTLDLLEGDTQSAIEEEYDAEVLVWKPEAGFAILGSSLESDLLPQSLELDSNQDSIKMPATALAFGGWNQGIGGWNQGAGGWNQGAGGWNQGTGGWNQGAGGWIAGVNSAYLSKNEAYWEQIELFAAHYSSTTLGKGVKIAVIDTGIDLNHPMFVDSLAPQSEWRDYVDYDYLPQDILGGYGSGHGTAVAGIILQVAPQAKVLPIRVLNQNGIGDMDHVIYAIDHAIESGANIINLSLGTDINSSTLSAMATYAKNQGVYLVAAAGNTGMDNTLLYPAKLANLEEYKGSLFAVGSVGTNDAISTFSTARSRAMIFAPGEGIQTAFPGESRATVTGTSFAAPMFAGSLALAYSELATTTEKQDMQSYVNSGLERQRLESKFYTSSTNWRHGNGVLNANAMVNGTKISNLSFESNSLYSSWSNSHNLGVTEQFTGETHRRNGKQFARITKRGYISQELSNLRPNTKYEVQIFLGFDNERGQGTVSIFNGRNNTQKDFYGYGRRYNLSYVTMAFTTGSSVTNTHLDISNWGNKGNLFIDEIRLKALGVENN